MERKLSTLGCVVLLFWVTQVERAHTPTVDGSMLVQNNPVLQPASVRVRKSLLEGRFITEAHKENFRKFLSIPLSLPIKFISWSYNVKAFLDLPIVQQNCLTTAVYFEARSESALGQLAVATVVLNRVQNSNSSICGVVYKGADYLNACQFSFACDGNPDVVEDDRAWSAAKKIANLAVMGDTTAKGKPMEVLKAATNYHADYVNPKWSKSLTRLAKIGRHIFYSESPVVGFVGTRKKYI